MELLKINNVTKDFGGLKALEDVSLDLTKGELLGLIGPNGAGKTTLFNIISGIYPLTSGEVFFEGKDITSLKSHKRPYLAIGRTFQNIKLFKDLTIVENVMLGRHSKMRINLLHAAFHLPLQKKEEEQTEKKAFETLDFVGILHLANEKVSDLPYGQQRLVEIARALAMEPLLLLLDEPCAGLNSRETEDLRKKLLVIKDSGVTIMCVEHNMKLIMSISDRIVVLNHGVMIASGTPYEISKNPNVIEAYLGKGGD